MKSHVNLEWVVLHGLELLNCTGLAVVGRR